MADPNQHKLEESLKDLLSQLGLVDLINDASSDYNEIRFLVAQKDIHIRLEIHKENTQHKAPHFHIYFKEEHEATYRIAPLGRFAGDMPRKYERPMLEWARNNTNHLLFAWNQVQTGVKPLVIQV